MMPSGFTSFTKKKLVAASLVSLCVIGLAGCGEDSIYAIESLTSSPTTAQRDPNHIYANHDKGIDPDIDPKEMNTQEKFDRLMAIYEKGGVKQTTDWLAICNQVNVPALRKMGFDPQRDLNNRDSSPGKYNCYWTRDKGRLAFYFGRAKSLEAVKARKDFTLTRMVERNNQTYYLGNIRYFGKGTVLQAFSCSVTFERSGVTYLASFNGKDPKTHEQACDELIEMVSPKR